MRSATNNCDLQFENQKLKSTFNQNPDVNMQHIQNEKQKKNSTNFGICFTLWFLI